MKKEERRNSYWIYIHRVDGIPVYIGATGDVKDRPYKLSSRSKEYKEFLNGRKPEVVLCGPFPEDKVWDMESVFIRKYGLITENGTLYNKTKYKSGRKNNFKKGWKHTEEAKRKISESTKGRTAHNKGKKMSEEQRLKLSKARKGMKFENHPQTNFKYNWMNNGIKSSLVKKDKQADYLSNDWEFGRLKYK
jgi:hypothetical protein